MQYAPIEKLSGGERRRLYLLWVLMGAPNVLLLDEPTNDLDIPTLVTLEDYLEGFGGCLIVVSHDRYFLDRTVEHIFRFEGGGRVREYPGNYTAFIEARRKEDDSVSAPLPAKYAARSTRANTTSGAKRKLSFKERQELGELEARIEATELRQAEIEDELAASSSDSNLVLRLYEEREALAAQLTADLERWAELAELA
jgi:ATP-binding cassette subfamily F protein uup